MPTIEALTRRREPVSPKATAADVHLRFENEPSLRAVAVVDQGRPVGLIERETFLLAHAAPAGRARFVKRSAAEVMDAEPAVVEAGVSVEAFCDVLLKSGPDALLHDFIVTRAGQYLGVGSGVALLQAINRNQRRENQDLTEQVRILSDPAAQALTAARARSQFLTVMSHELRTPMNGVLAIAELLRRQPLNAQAQAHVGTIIESSETLLRVLQDALDLSRAEAGELELQAEATPLQGLMDDIQSIWAPRASRDNVRLMVGYEGDTELAAVTDGARLKQVFNNLIGNALKFARDGVVEASLRAVRQGDHIQLEGRVRDQGPGVDPARLDSLFQPFAHGAGPDGPGMGLAICRQIVEGLGGRIWAENNAGRGATFAFDLTADRAVHESETPSNVETLTDLDLDAAPHVLIVDDNATNRVVAQALCEMFGCSCETAEDGVEALDAVQARRFDLVLMDIKMPRMDGVQATMAIRALPGDVGLTPIVALTANADPEDARAYLAVGMAAVVEKPIKPERLRLAMNTALDAGAQPAATGSVRSVA